ncbi:ABC transporter permease [Bradyrhizobium sp. WD16]|nr:ABC transporter permease [Bradyrhizobium sp. WD16]
MPDAAWGAVGLTLLGLGWSLLNRTYGPFVLPSLTDTATALGHILTSGEALPAIGTTVLHAVGGGLLGAAVGTVVGVAGGRVRLLGAAIAPVATVVLGIPPIAWVVLSLLWFGPGGLGPLFTVAITTMPIVFAATLQGMRARDPHLIEMARVFRLPVRSRLLKIMMPELATILAPALASAFAIAWKVALTAEVLGDGSGAGGRFATARAHLDLAEAMAWILLVVGFVLASDLLLLGRLRRWMARSRSPRQRRNESDVARATALRASQDGAC